MSEADEECDPAFTHHGLGGLPLFEDQGVRGRVVAGNTGSGGECKIALAAFLSALKLAAGVRAELPADYSERAIYVATGAIELDNQRIDTGRMAVLSSSGTAASLTLEPSTVMAIGGEPIGQRFIDWNFVSSSKKRVERAKTDWLA